MASTDIQRTFGTPTNAKKYTFSMWLKRNSTGVIDWISSAPGDFSNITFDANDRIDWAEYTSGYKYRIVTTRKFRDPAAWYHICFTFDSTLAEAGDRQRLYINGVEETVFTTDTNPTLNYDTVMNSAVLHSIRSQKGEGYANYGYGILLSHVHFIDGTAYPASTFGETDSTSGIWKIKTSPTVTYGDNGFFIFKDNASVTDQSGEGNNWTASNGTLTATEDNPSNNFCTGNPLDNYYQEANYSTGNNTVELTQPGGNHGYCSSTLGVAAGLWYFEAKPTTGDVRAVGFVDILQPDSSENIGQGGTGSSFCFKQTGQTKQGGSSTAYGNTYSTDDIIGCYLDLTANKAYFAINGTVQNSGTGLAITAADSTTTGFYKPGADSTNGSDTTWQFNFGNGYFGTTAVTSAVADAGGIGAFEYDPSAGTFDSASKDFRAICTKNIKAYGG